MKRDIWIGLLFLLGGILCAQLLGSEFFGNYGYLNEYQLQSFAYSKMDKMDLFWNVLWDRGKLFLVFVLICATSMRKLLPIVGKSLLGFLIGIFGTVCVMHLGAYGILFLLATLFPHWILYLAVLIMIYRFRPMYSHEGKRKNTRFFLQILLIWMLFLAGCVSETLIGTQLLQLLLKIVYPLA